MTAGAALGPMGVGPTGLESRAIGLARAAEAAQGRLADEPVARARAVLEQLRQRQALAPELTVVALAGPTGAGKSSVLNHLAGQDLAAVGARRPTTSEPMAALWTTPASAGPLLEWLGVARVHVVHPGGGAPGVDPSLGDGAVAGERSRPQDPAGARSPDPGPDPAELAGLVLVDLPDIDSTQSDHRAHADRLVERVDVMIWVLDPQKYADRQVHEDYLARYARHAEVVLVLLNQVDRLDPADGASCLDHLGRLVAADGLPGARVLGVSAVSGSGLPQVRGAIADMVAARTAAAARLAADIASSADSLQRAAGDLSTAARPVPPGVAHELADALAEAAGAGLVGEAVSRAVMLRGRRATAWPVVGWVHGLRRDPLERLRLGRPGVDPALVRTSLPSASPVALARASIAARAYASVASSDAPPSWVRSTRDVAVRAVSGLGPQLDAAVARAEVSAPRQPAWWAAVRVTQWLVLAVAALGGLWLLGTAALSALAFDAPEPATAGGVPVPTLMLLTGVLSGLVLGACARFGVRGSARRAGAAAVRAVTSSVAEVARIHVEEPVAAELATLSEFRIGLVAAQGG